MPLMCRGGVSPSILAPMRVSGSAILFIGYDGACHMAEEVKNAAINVPRAMFVTIFINGLFGFATYIFVLYCFGNPQDVLSFEGLAFVEIFLNATNKLREWHIYTNVHGMLSYGLALRTTIATKRCSRSAEVSRTGK